MSSAVIIIDKNKTLDRWDGFDPSITNDNPVHAGSLAFDCPIKKDANVKVGVWQCSPCTLKVEQTTNEICVLIEGAATITDQSSGEVFRFSAGDAFVLCKNSKITWVIDEYIKKYYITIAD